ncbi:MAG: tagatose-bisphosphate aldolase [Bacillales bacterium]|jgi:D-tagatose-1,6-bisphosphate aldolase subunit GatZ/KbaZ|nr:tagatose-bisphosphate aldolase [Bacillales bacterium]
MNHPIMDMIKRYKTGKQEGIFSICTSNQTVIEAVMEKLRNSSMYLMIEATANQVDQFGGYTGMKPIDFKRYVEKLCVDNNFPFERVILGGDHLGPLTWKNQQSSVAMNHAKELIRQYVLAGFTKIHIDTSMPLVDDGPVFGDEIIAERAGVLCKVAEEAFLERLKSYPDALHPVYVIGSEVPIPGGAEAEEEESHGIQVTSPDAFEKTVHSFKNAFEKAGIGESFDYVVGVVVQPGVEFGSEMVWDYNREKAKTLSFSIEKYPNIVFEAHSTDYQTKENLRALVEDGFAILKVGPALTFALREGLFALSHIENELIEEAKRSNFIKILDETMILNPVYWEKHYHGSDAFLRCERKYSLSDRSRYYLPNKEVQSSIDRLIENLKNVKIPMTLVSQYMNTQYKEIRNHQLKLSPVNLLKSKIGEVVEDYIYATRASK